VRIFLYHLRPNISSAVCWENEHKIAKESLNI